MNHGRLDTKPYALVVSDLQRRSKYEMLSVLLGEMLIAKGVDVSYLFEAGKEELAFEIISVRRMRSMVERRKQNEETTLQSV